jgi:hypothetical protein
VYDALIAQALDAPPDRRLRQADALTHVRGVDAGLGLL